jgi:hypothetical protein
VYDYLQNDLGVLLGYIIGMGLAVLISMIAASTWGGKEQDHGSEKKRKD